MACHADHGHPDTGHDVNAALGKGADAAALAPTAAQEGIEAEGEGAEPGEGKEQACGEGKRHAVSLRALPRSFTRIPRGAHAGEEGAELRVVAQGGELQRLLEVLGVLLAGGDGLLDVVEGGGVVAAAGPYAGERRESGGVAGVEGDGPREELFGGLVVVGRGVEARVGILDAGVAGVAYEGLF